VKQIFEKWHLSEVFCGSPQYRLKANLTSRRWFRQMDHKDVALT
jgi:hypothetical protein